MKRIVPLLLSFLCLVGGETAVSGPSHTLYLPFITRQPYGANLLPNPSFEAGWHHPGGIPELQIPNAWTFSWQEGDNPLAPEPWNEFVRPEVRVLTSAFLPPEEHDLFIWDGDQTLKVFKGFGSIQFRLETAVALQPGDYVFEIFVFPDLVVDYEDGKKVWAPDPLSGEVLLHAGGASTDWLLPTFGKKNAYRLAFSVRNPTTMTIGASFRGRWAIRNNGWFLDDWGVYRMVE